MKKTIILLLSICLLLSMCGCGNTNGTGGNSENSASQASEITFSDTYELNGRTFAIPNGFSKTGNGTYRNEDTGTELSIYQIDLGGYESMLPQMGEEEFNIVLESCLDTLEEKIGEELEDRQKAVLSGMKGLKVSVAQTNGRVSKICSMIDTVNCGVYYVALTAGENGEEDIYYRKFDKILDEIK